MAHPFAARKIDWELVAVLALLAIFPVALPSYSAAAEVVILAIAVCANNLLLGYTGLLSFGQAIFFGSGAYTAGLLLTRVGPSAGVGGALAAAAAAGAVAALLVGALSIRQRGLYMVMITFAFAQAAFFAAYSMPSFTGGENGLLSVPRPPLALPFAPPVSLDSSGAFYAFAAAVFFAAFAFLRRVVHSPLGRTLVAIRDNEDRAIAVGYDTRRWKLVAFIISGAVTGLAGALSALQLGSVPLSHIEPSMAETILIMTILGGTRSLAGSVVGTALVLAVGEHLSPLWPRWQLLLGLALIAVVIFLPNGICAAVDDLRSRLGLGRGRGGESSGAEVGDVRHPAN